MKTIRLFFTLIFILILRYAYCDIIPENSHFVDKCTKITNISEYDNLVMLGYIWYIGNYHLDTYEISSSECLTKGYKFNTLRIFAVEADYIASKDINDIDLPNDKHALETNIKIDPYAGYLNDSIPIDKIEEYYKILGFTDGSVVIFKWKEVFGFNNGSADSIISYEYTGDINLLYKNISTGTGEVKKSLSNIFLYPNPADKFIVAKISNTYIGLVSMQLISPNGEIISTKKIYKSSALTTTKFSTANLTKGLYLLNFQFGEVVETKQIVIR